MKSEIVPIYKQQGDPLECGNFRGIKLLEHGIKMFEKIIERKLRKLIKVNNMQFRFSPGKGTTNEVFIIQHLQEKHPEVHKVLFLTFVDLEKAYNRVPRDLVYWCLRRRGVLEKLVRLVEATYNGASTVVRTTHGRTDEFPIKVGLHHGSVLYVISEEFRCGLPSELLFADDLAVVIDTEEEMQRRWQIGMENKGLKVNIGKTEVMVSSRRGTKVNIKDRQVNKFKYLGVTISEEGGSEEAVRASVSAGWGKWRDLFGVICDKKMPRELKIKFYMTVIRPILLYGAECWTVRMKQEQILEKTEMRMLRRRKGVTLRDRVKSADIRKELGVSSTQEKVREMRLR